MAAPRRTQKQIAERYKTNLGYYRKKHPWRRTRFWVGFLVPAAGIAAIAAFQLHGRETFFNPGKISSSHGRFADDCAQCHDNSATGGRTLTAAQFKATLRERFRHGVAFGPIDRNCEACHVKQEGRTHTFHEANVVQDRSCSACHQEHRGPGPLKLVASSNCVSCHGNAATMQASARKGMQLPTDAFHRHPHPAQQVAFDLPRPARGYTQTFSSFWNGHPEFQLTREQNRDPDVLRFNHQRHFAADIPLLNGKKLNCNYCHTPDLDGRYYQRITFAANCQACHSLQFDPRNPDLTLPHGNATGVRGFLRSLPTQYADLAVRKGMTDSKQIQAFVAKQIAQLRERVRSGEELERQVFFTTNPYKAEWKAPPQVRASFYGCAFCHEVKPVANAAPVITKPVFVDRWVPQANFNHAKHASVKCDDCHHAMQSRDTSDILMPVKANCVTCHSPAGKVVAECITCHTFHGSPSAVTADTSRGTQLSIKQMLLGNAGGGAVN
jgi:predicted CXXCH cytochrome family protein